jgi:predicted S18 family serine protease
MPAAEDLERAQLENHRALHERISDYNRRGAMNLATVQEIERAIAALTPQELEELYSWLDQHETTALDKRIESDLSAGRLDSAIQHALEDEKQDRTELL